MNLCSHLHRCIECGKPMKCENPECMTLASSYSLCRRCSHYHGGAQAKYGKAMDS